MDDTSAEYRHLNWYLDRLEVGLTDQQASYLFRQVFAKQISQEQLRRIGAIFQRRKPTGDEVYGAVEAYAFISELSVWGLPGHVMELKKPSHTSVQLFQTLLLEALMQQDQAKQRLEALVK